MPDESISNGEIAVADPSLRRAKRRFAAWRCLEGIRALDSVRRLVDRNLMQERSLPRLAMRWVALALD